jgi:hypothetical protein
VAVRVLGDRNGAGAVQLTHNGGYSAQESFDGKMLCFTKGPSKAGLWRQPSGGGAEELVTAELRGANWELARREGRCVLR